MTRFLWTFWNKGHTTAATCDLFFDGNKGFDNINIASVEMQLATFKQFFGTHRHTGFDFNAIVNRGIGRIERLDVFGDCNTRPCGINAQIFNLVPITDFLDILRLHERWHVVKVLTLKYSIRLTRSTWWCDNGQSWMVASKWRVVSNPNRFFIRIWTKRFKVFPHLPAVNHIWA